MLDSNDDDGTLRTASANAGASATATPRLSTLRERVRALASEAGEYRLVGACLGDEPVPAAGLRFADRATARAAARATERYRRALRRYDPELPRYDVDVERI